jgi:hypothetical protein
MPEDRMQTRRKRKQHQMGSCLTSDNQKSPESIPATIFDQSVSQHLISLHLETCVTMFDLLSLSVERLAVSPCHYGTCYTIGR